jgi:hypothetical protein
VVPHGCWRVAPLTASRDLPCCPNTSRLAPRLSVNAQGRRTTDTPPSRGTTSSTGAIAYLTAKLPCLIYRIALTMGWPIATGVIEGARGYLVKDRLALTGARWSLPGAEASWLRRVRPRCGIRCCSTCTW